MVARSFAKEERELMEVLYTLSVPPPTRSEFLEPYHPIFRKSIGDDPDS